MRALGFLRPNAAASAGPSVEAAIPVRQPRLLQRLASIVMLVAVAAVAGGISGGLVAHYSERTTEPASRAEVSPAPPPSPPGLPDIPSIIENIRQSVVAIDVTVTSTGPRPISSESSGSGFVLTSDGMIATNAHVVSGARRISVTLPDGSTLAATVVGSDTGDDLAVIHVDRTDLVPMPLGKSAELRVGDLVIAVGNALALEGGPTASMGIVSALNRTITATDGRTISHLIQTDAAINEGDSGGPLTDRNGQLIGINAVGTSSAENIGFAIAIDDAAPVLERLRSSE